MAADVSAEKDSVSKKEKPENLVLPGFERKVESKGEGEKAKPQKVEDFTPLSESTRTIYRGEIVEHGEAKYKNDPKEQKSYYLTLKQLNGEDITLWGKGLPESIPKDAKKGDYIGVERGERERVLVDVVVRGADGVESIEKKEAIRQKWLEVNVNQEKDRTDFAAQKNNSDQQKSGTRDSAKSFVHTKDELEEAERKARKPSLDRLMPGADIENRYIMTVEKNKNSYADRRKPDVKLVEDRGDSLKASHVTPESVELIIKISKQKDWDKINISGTKDFKRQVWMEASKEGIEVKGYSPSKEELKMLEKYMATNQNKENIVKPIVDNAKGYAAENIKSPKDQERFTEAVKEKANETIRTEGTPKLNEQARQRDSAKEAEPARKDKSKDIER